MQLHLCLCCVCYFQLVHEFKNKMQSKTNYMYVYTYTYIKGCTLWLAESVGVSSRLSVHFKVNLSEEDAALCSSLKSPCVYIGEEQLLFYMTLAFVYPFYFITLLVCSYADRLFSLRSSRRVRETCGKISPSRQFFLILIAFAHHPHTHIHQCKQTNTHT